ncbi:MAG: cytochrome c, partial [Anaerolineae bacterium]|nr:cytochrome c [Anaerolineae bacterium]
LGDTAKGESLWSSLPCQECHGEKGEGVYPIPAIQRTELDIQQFAEAVRRGPADMPAFTHHQVSDEEIAHLYAYLTSE